MPTDRPSHWLMLPAGSGRQPGLHATAGWGGGEGVAEISSAPRAQRAKEGGWGGGPRGLRGGVGGTFWRTTKPPLAAAQPLLLLWSGAASRMGAGSLTVSGGRGAGKAPHELNCTVLHSIESRTSRQLFILNALQTFSA